MFQRGTRKERTAQREEINMNITEKKAVAKQVAIEMLALDEKGTQIGNSEYVVEVADGLVVTAAVGQQPARGATPDSEGT